MGKPFEVKTWSTVPGNVEVVWVNGSLVKDFASLAALPRLRRLAAVCDKPGQMEAISGLASLELLELRHQGAKGLTQLGALPGLRALNLDVYRSASLDGVERQQGLRHLRVWHAPKLDSLAPIAALENLEWLEISTPPGWVPSRKTIKVESLAPLSGLKRLRYLSLTGVEPLDGGLTPLHGLSALEELDFSHVFSLGLADYAKLAAALPGTAGTCLQPDYELPISQYFHCKKCGAEERWLTAPPKRAMDRLCPSCDAGKLAAHRQAFEDAKS